MLRKTIFFLILLRLAIGWHFFFEGWHKIHSTWEITWEKWYPAFTSRGQTETSRPFTSEPFFRNGTGPLGPVFRGQLGADPDEAALARLKATDGIPQVLSDEIDNYTAQFLKSFNLSDAEKTEAEKKAKEAKEKIVVFLTTSVSGGQHVTDYRAKLAELHKLSDNKTPNLGRDVDNKRIMDLKGAVAQARKESLDELDKEMGKVLRDELSGILKKKLGSEKLTSVAKDEDVFVVLVPQSDGKSLPKPYEERWNEYYIAFKATYPLTDAQLKTAESKFNTAKGLTTQWLAGKQAIPVSVIFGELTSAEPNPLIAASSLLAVREGLVSDAREENEQMKRYLNAALTDDQAKGAPPTVKAESPRFLIWIDQLTMWGLLVMGGCLLLGLLTRTNCVLAAGFLLMTYLIASPFPWLPSPPNNVGYDLFVNKNLIEMLALLVLATTHSGRWFGLDAILHRIFGREKPTIKPVRPSARAA